MRDNWYHHWVAGATLDDQLWHQALVMDRVLESLRGSKQGPNDAMMWTLLRVTFGFQRNLDVAGNGGSGVGSASSR